SSLKRLLEGGAALFPTGGRREPFDDEPFTKRAYADALAGKSAWFRLPGRLALLLGDRSTSLTWSLRVSNRRFDARPGGPPATRAPGRVGWGPPWRSVMSVIGVRCRRGYGEHDERAATLRVRGRGRRDGGQPLRSHGRRGARRRRDHGTIDQREG